MEKDKEESHILRVSEYKDRVHVVLAHSYFVYFLMFLVGVFFD